MPSKKPQQDVIRTLSASGSLTGSTPAVLGDKKSNEPLMIEGTPRPQAFPTMKQPAYRLPPSGPMADILHLSASVLLAPGAQASPNKQSLTAPKGKGMFIHEIKFDVAMLASDNPTVVSPDAQFINFGAVIAASFKLGDLPITAQFVPLGMFSPCRKIWSEICAATASGTFGGSTSQYSWQPDEPIYVPPGALLEPMLMNLGFLNYNLRVRISYAGKIADNSPQRTRLPYIAFWKSPNFIVNGTEVEQDSTEKDLVNLLDRPIRVERILGRVFQIYQAASSPGPGYPPVTIIEGTQPTIAISTTINYYAVLNQTKIRMTSSWGTKPIGDWTNWPAAFDMLTRSIEAAHEIPAGGFYIANVLCGSEPRTDSQAMVCLSLVGSREVTP